MGMFEKARSFEDVTEKFLYKMKRRKGKDKIE